MNQFEINWSGLRLVDRAHDGSYAGSSLVGPINTLIPRTAPVFRNSCYVVSPIKCHFHITHTRRWHPQCSGHHYHDIVFTKTKRSPSRSVHTEHVTIWSTIQSGERSGTLWCRTIYYVCNVGCSKLM